MKPSSQCRRPRGVRSLAAALVLLGACENGNLGKAPPTDQLFFPSGLLLDPRALPGEPAKYLFVVNSNNDLSYNAGTVVAIDLDDFFARWSLTDAQGEPTYVVDPYCGGDGARDRCVLDVGSGTNASLPCRRLALLPQVVECDEAPFVDEVVRTGDFATVLTASCDDPDHVPGTPCTASRLWLPVRGDPSVTYIDLVDDPPRNGSMFACGQDEDPDERCAKSHRLTHLLNEPDLVEMDREPFNLLVSPTQPLAYVTHSDGTSLSLLDLRQPNQCCYPSALPSCNIDSVRACVCEEQGHTECCEGESSDPQAPDRAPPWSSECVRVAEEECGVCRPAMIDQTSAFPSLGGLPGGLGLAERPCTPGENAPSITLDCQRPLVYAGFRYSRLLVSFTVQGVTPEELVGEDAQYEQKCAGPGEIDEELTVACDPRIRSQRQVFPGGLDPGGASFTPVLGDIAFADERGDQLLVLQTNPGALLLLDTRVGTDGEVVDNPSRPPLEVCDQPTRMKLYEENGQRFALISCYRAAAIFVVDLDAFRVLNPIVAGTGPFELEVDHARRLLYVSNNLESSVSVIDLAQDRPTRFAEIARIGLQEPFSR